MRSSEESRRDTERHPLSVDLKFLLDGWRESAGVLLDISETGLALISDTCASEGDDIVVYPMGLGRLSGKVVRTFNGGMAIKFDLSRGQREIVRDRLASILEEAPHMRAREKRTSFRIHYNIETFAFVADEGKGFSCTIRDMSRTGCRLQSDVKPGIGDAVIIGTLEGYVVRHVEDGFAIGFQRHAPRALLEDTRQLRTA